MNGRDAERFAVARPANPPPFNLQEHPHVD